MSTPTSGSQPNLAIRKEMQENRLPGTSLPGYVLDKKHGSSSLSAADRRVDEPDAFLDKRLFQYPHLGGQKGGCHDYGATGPHCGPHTGRANKNLAGLLAIEHHHEYGLAPCTYFGAAPQAGATRCVQSGEPFASDVESVGGKARRQEILGDSDAHIPEANDSNASHAYLPRLLKLTDVARCG